MAQSENLLATFNVEGKHQDDFWQQRMMALTAGGLDDFQKTLRAALESGDATVVQEAQRALSQLKGIATMRGVTREAVVTAFGALQPQYIGSRNATAQGMRIKRETPAAQVYAEYPSLYATCHAHAAAALRAEVQRPAPVATEAPNPAPTPAGRGEKPAAPAKPAKPAPKPAGKPATKPAVTGEIGLAGEPGGFDFSPVDTPDAAAPTGMDDIDFQIEKEPVDEDLERLLGLRTDDEKPKKPGRVDPSKPKR